MATHHVVIHGIEHARCALAEAAARGDRVLLVSAEGAALYGGAAWFREIVALATSEFGDAVAGAILDCGDAPGIALGALRAGIKDICLDCPPSVRARVEDIAKQVGARLVPRPSGPMLDMATATDPGAAARDWFGKE